MSDYEYVQRAIYGPNHGLSHMMHDRVHLAINNKTLCGKDLNHMWFIVGDSTKNRLNVTCRKCLKLQQRDEQ